jgi:hypothetical protein
MPRYLPGKEDILPGKFWMRLCTSWGCKLIGKISVLLMFTCRPKQFPKNYRIFCKFDNSWEEGFAKSAASLA